MNKKYIIGNWKLNGNIKSISMFFQYIKSKISNYLKHNIVIIAPSTVYLERVYKNIKDMSIFLGAQDVDINQKGAFTGETSIAMLKDIGVNYVIIGHSERRRFHNENNEIIKKKFNLIQNFQLTPILCIGESETEKKQKKTKEILAKQLNIVIKCLEKQTFSDIIIAYEPVWAIGTGMSADPEYVQSIHKFIKDYIYQYSPNYIKKLIVSYGGSVNSQNSLCFLEQPDIDGLLIGNASLVAEEFLKILEISNSFYINQ